MTIKQHLFIAVLIAGLTGLSGFIYAQVATSASIHSIDTNGKYVFYLHGRIIENEGVNAISPEYGPYEYEKILQTFKDNGFHVISEARPKDTDYKLYAKKVAGQIDTLLNANVKPDNITVVGASKGGYITVAVSSYVENPEINYVFMGICSKETMEDLNKEQLALCGNILSINEQSDAFGGSCKGFANEGKCVTHFKEIQLNMGNGHGFLYKPYKEWTLPAMDWANKKYN